MNTLLLIGSSSEGFRYAQQLKEKLSLPSSHLVQIDSRVKIENVRNIQRLCNQFSRRGDRYLFLLPCDITVEAQNALLKLLEELPENITFMIRCKSEDMLLPTVVSRCKIVRLAREVVDTDVLVREALDVIFFQNASSSERLFTIFRLSEYIDGGEVQIEAFLSTLRECVRSVDFEKNSTTSFLLFSKRFLERLPYLGRNNLNTKLTIESLLLSSI